MGILWVLSCSAIFLLYTVTNNSLFISTGTYPHCLPSLGLQECRQPCSASAPPGFQRLWDCWVLQSTGELCVSVSNVEEEARCRGENKINKVRRKFKEKENTIFTNMLWTRKEKKSNWILANGEILGTPEMVRVLERQEHFLGCWAQPPFLIHNRLIVFISCHTVLLCLILTSAKGRQSGEREESKDIAGRPCWHRGQSCAHGSPPWRPCPPSSSSHLKPHYTVQNCLHQQVFISRLQPCCSVETMAWNTDVVLVPACQTTRLLPDQTLPKNSFQGDVVQLQACCQDLIRSCTWNIKL